MNLKDIKLEVLPETLTVGKITDNEYFSKKYSHYVSNSRLGCINPKQDGSPEKFFNSMQPFYSDSLILGSAVHTIVLQPELFELVDIDRPSAKLGFVCDYIWDHSDDSHDITDKLIIEASETIGYYKDKLTDKIIEAIKTAYSTYKVDRSAYITKEGVEPMFLSHKLFDTANKCISACNANEKFAKIMHPDYMIEEPISENEQAFLVDVKCTFPDKDPIILKIKAKLDNYTVDFDTNTIVVNDLKTIGSILSKFDGEEGNFGRFHYSRELAEYLWLLRLYVKQKYGMTNPTMKVNCLVVSTIPDYYTKVYEVTNKEINQGFQEFRMLLRLVAYYMAYKGYEFK